MIASSARCTSVSLSESSALVASSSSRMGASRNTARRNGDALALAGGKRDTPSPSMVS